MAIRFIHTADWHLGQLFHQHSRYKEHEQFLQQLLDYITQYQPHALLIAGDIFDVINPPSQAQKQLNQFLSQAHQRAKHMQILMIAGNHDSGYRIEQINPLLEKYQAKAVGVLQWKHDEQGDQLDYDQLIIPIYDEHQQVIAWCVALPFLRSAEMTGRNITSIDPIEASEKIYKLLLNEVQRRREKHQAVIMMTHAHLQGGSISQESERSIIIGNEEALSVKNFVAMADYVALGHLHKAQKVQHDYIRYSGSPIPLSFSEAKYHHQVMLVDLDVTQENPLQLTPLSIPHLVQLYRISCLIDELEEKIKALPQGEIEDIELRHFLEIEYYSPDLAPPDLRQKIEQLLPAKRYRLLRLTRKIQHTNHHLSNVLLAEDFLQPPTPLELFKTIWLKEHPDLTECDAQLLQDFSYLEQLAQEQE